MRYLTPEEVHGTEGLEDWARSIANDSAHYPMGALVRRDWGPPLGDVIARVEVHTVYGGDPRKPKVPHRSCGLLHPDETIERPERHAPILGLAQGIDVSGWSPHADWNALRRAGMSFAFVKVSEGFTVGNAQLREQWAGCDAAGVVQGAYHFFRAATSTPEDQAHHVEAVLAPLSVPELGLAVDVESQTSKEHASAAEQLGGVSPTVFADRLVAFCDRAIELGQPLRWLYTSEGFASLLPPELFTHLHGMGLALWQAAYRSSAPKPIAPFSQWDIWQHTARGTIAGMPGDVADLNHARCELAELLTLGPGAAKKPVPDDEGDRPTRRMDLFDLALRTPSSQ